MLERAESPHPSLAVAVIIAASALVPLSAEPLRFAGDESYRAGLLLALVSLCALCWRPGHVRRLSGPLASAVAFWCAALTVSAVFSLSPARALFGDTLRHMGLWTTLALVFAFVLGATTSFERLWRWFWLAGVAAALYLILEFAGVLNQSSGRPEGPLGLSTTTASWLALALIWSVVGVGRQAARAKRWQTLASGVGLLLMLIGLALTGARAALLGLAVGLTLLGLAYTAASRRRRGALLILLIVALAGAGWTAANALPAAQVPPLAARLKLNLDDGSLSFRRTVWSNSLRLAATWPVLTDLNGQPDRWAALRPLVGYGQEMFEVVHRPLLPGRLDVPGQRVDRAHNDWLDTLITLGGLGIAARALLWGAVWWVALRRLKLNRREALILPAAGALAAGLLASALAPGWLPPAITLGALTGAGLWLAANAFASPSSVGGQLDPHALLALGVVACHLIDVQFGFEQATTGWPMWLAIGLLAAPVAADATSETQPDARRVWIWAGLAGAILVRALVLSGTSVGACLLLVALLWVAVGTWVRPPLRVVLLALALLVAAWLSTRLTNPVWTALADLLLMLGGLMLLAGRRPALPTTRRAVAALVVAVLGLTLWTVETMGQVLTRQGSADDLRAAADLLRWDDRIAADGAAAAFARLQQQLDADGTFDQAALDTTARLLDRSAWLNGYDADHALQWATVEANLALIAQNPQPHLDRAAHFFAAATTLWPSEADLWVAWGRFALDVQHDAPQAYQLGRLAVCLPPLRLDAIKLLRQAGRAARIPPYVDCDQPAAMPSP